jgi:hypothetical protein
MRTSLLNRIENSPAVALQNNATGKESVLRVLAYFDIFHYPLPALKLKSSWINRPIAARWINAWPNCCMKALFFLYQDLYSLQNNPLVIQRRHLGQQRAEKLLKKAMGIGRFLYQFPFVRAVAISGSLSKNFADEKADIDFFIITKANRLWLARTFMHLFKKFTFLTGRQHYYCMNYYIDEDALLLEEKNIFTAIELKTLLPICGEHSTNHFFKANQWADKWLPSCEYRDPAAKGSRQNVFKRFGEWIFNNWMGNALDNIFLK